MKVILTIIVCSSISILIDGSHYRGGFITWKPQYPHITNQNPVSIMLKQRHVWNRDIVPCDNNTIANKVQIGGGTIKCISAKCYNVENLPSVAAPCVAYSVKNVWSAGEKSTLVNISANITFEAAFQGGAWIGSLGVGAGGLWSISTGITTIPRSDGTYNTPPSSSMSSIKLLRVGSTYTWDIPVADTDGDIIRCRWAKRGPPDECAAVCNGFPGAILNSYPCVMTYNANSTGFWVVALKIEDFEFSSQITPLSSTSIQFIVNVYKDTGGCTTLPFYYGTQPPGACISVNVGSTINEIAQFSIGCENTNVTEVDIYKPDDMIVGAIKVDPLNSSLYTMTVTWTPTSTQLGVNLVCYTPLDSNNQQGNQICIKYFVNDDDQKFARSEYIKGSMNPVGQVYSNQSVWHIQYMNEVRRPSVDAYIRFYSKSTNQQVHQINVRTNLNDVIYSNNDLTFFTSMTWNLGEQYYILFDSSIVTDPTVCGPQSPNIVDTNYWTFEVMDVDTTCFSPIITLIPNTSSLLSPLQFRRSQDFYISSNIQLDCKDSLAIITKWTIQNCTLNCSSPVQIDQTIITTFRELFIPARTFPYGIYELKLTVTMNISTSLTSSASAYVTITPSGITANIVELGTLMITHGHQQDLILDPGRYSIDPDEDIFNPNGWKYEYYCRIYGISTFQKLLVSNDLLNTSCFNRNRTLWHDVGISDSPKSSLIITAGSLLSNRTYQFMVHMEYGQNSSIEATGYVLVKVEDTRPHMIAVACIISKMCNPNLEYQSVNPTTQVALFSICTGNCTTILNITWNIYQGSILSSNVIQWERFNQINLYKNIWFFGKNTRNFTVTNQLFMAYPQIEYWRFEVVYSFVSETSTSALNFIINHPPENGSCSISPRNGTTNTLFNIFCANWTDEHEIKDYLVYVWNTDPSQRLMIGFSTLSDFQVRLPAGDENTSILNVIIHIRDKLDCITEWNMSSIVVKPDTKQISALIDNLQSSTSETNANPLIRLLAGGNQNTAAQIITLLSQELNKMNINNLHNAISNSVPATNIFVSSLGSLSLQREYFLLNQSALNEYCKLLNIHAKIRDYLITYMTNFAIFGSASIKLQASALVQLTQSTNQLTRTTSILASEQCHQLANVLYSMATKIPYEDVYTAAALIAQCVSNVMTAINGPLQKRTSILDLDWSRANDFPIDYDTNLELEWANPNLFADGNDFSYETIRKGRNTYYQRQIADTIIGQMTETISLLTSALNIHLNIDQNMTINTSSVFMTLITTSIESLSNKPIKQIENTQIHIPLNLKSNISNDSIISFRLMIQPLASADKSQSNTDLSRSVSFSILNQTNDELPIRTTFDHPIELIIPRDPNLIVPPMILENVTSSNDTPHNQLFNLNYINITSTLAISVHFEIHPLDENLAYLFIYKFDRLPILNSSINQTDGWKLFCPSNLTNDSIYTYFIDNQRTIDHQFIIYGLRELNLTEIEYFCSNQSITNPPITNERSNFTSNYEVRIYTSGCYYLDSNNNWQSDGLLVGNLTNHYQTQCYSTHLTTFTTGFVVLPKSIDWNYVFANADFVKNKTVYLTVICVCIIYLLLIIYARFKDKKDIEKLGVTSLPDNYKIDQYFYEIIVFTGHRKDAGTKSKVHFILAGDKNETRIRTLADPHRKILQQGGIDAFVMAVPKSLGSLNYLRIWHDNTGEGSSASWFLKYIVIRDLQTMEKFHFICQQWLAVEEKDGRIERVLPVANILEKQEFSYVLSKQVYYNISDGHLWFSIFSRPPSNKFTRVQRCTCCFVLFFISMFLNILYYDLSTEAKMISSNSLSIGPWYINTQQIVIGIIVELLSLCPSLLIVQLFRRTRLRRQKISPLCQTLNKMVQQSTIKNNVDLKKTKHSKLTFPWWCILIAYGLSFFLIVISIFIIIARGIEFGDLKTQKWLTSIIIGFFSSLFLSQPIKVLCLAIFFACFMRNTNNENELDDDNFHLSNDEEYIHVIKNKSSTNINHLNTYEIAYARKIRLKEIQMWLIIREIFTYLSFLIILYLITYSNRDENSFRQVHHLRKYFLKTKILTIDDYWNWLENNFIRNIRAQQWYNGKSPRNLSGFINDKSNRLIGWAIMKQLRIKSDLCYIDQIKAKCKEEYSFFNEEKRSFRPGWNNDTIEVFSSSINRAFEYQSGDQLDAYVYVGDHGIYDSGGYVYEFRGRLDHLRSNISKLHRLKWIDNQTKVVMIQISLYNPNVQLFTSVTFLIEFLSSGGIFLQTRFEPLNFHVFTSIFQIICIILYMIFIIYFMIIEIQLLIDLKLSYFQQFWSYIEFSIIICSWISVGFYVCRYRELKRISCLFKETNGYAYVNLQYAAFVNDVLSFLLGFCCFFSTLRFIRLGRFDQRLHLLSETLRYSGRKLISFAMMFSIVFIAFLSLFYLLFISKISACSNLLHTAQMLFEMTLLKFNASELYEAATFLGPFCFSLFILLVVFVCMSMFLSIINDSFEHARKNVNEDQKMISFMWSKFQCWIGLEKANERYNPIRPEYIDPIE